MTRDSEPKLLTTQVDEAPEFPDEEAAAEPAPAPAAAAAGDTSSESDLARATADDDQKLPDAVVKAIVASAIKGDESTVSALVEEFDQRLQASSAR